MIVRGLRGLLGVLLVASLVTTGCAKDKPKPLVIAPDKSPSAAPSLRTFSRSDPVQAYQGWVQAAGEAERLLDPGYPGLALYAQGPALAGVKGYIQKFRAQGIRPAKSDAVVNPHVTATGAAKGRRVVEVTACLIEPANGFVDAKTGKLKPPAGSGLQKPVTAVEVAVVVLMDDGWHVDGSKFTAVPSCPSPSR